ncbi:hypothetical protein CFP65_3969 [Kitasatospora sp. MMS16-BH015]|uniref:hypothetical protein n=1 Tax=Kitasatospora sp. MMS16-BH015 TaxID=2018025 RepID=UPI000CA31BAB|nr:hypothetical protein [Kitasatospora sp. MMS16-BH015]AUG78739.1 hypothetical protein CFP65_3969 [Kitasatospora sp. MMS16-BH015]
MKRIHRAGLAGAAAMVIAGMLPVQAAHAVGPVLGVQGAQCPVGAGEHWYDWSSQPLVVKAGEDDAQTCRVGINVGSEGAKALTLGLTVSAQTVAATGYTAEQLSRMISVQAHFMPAGGVGSSTEDGRWVVNGDGSLTLQLAAHDVRGGYTPGLDYDLYFSVAPALKSFGLKAGLELSTDGGAPQWQRDVLLSVVGNGHSVDFAPKSTFEPLTPARLLDTRNGTGVARGKVGPGGTVALQVAGRGGVPATGVSAVVLNVTATNPTAPGYVTVYPHGKARPTASNLNFTAGKTVPNQVTVPVVDGKVNLYNAFGTTDLVADVNGYYTPGDSGGRFTGLDNPARLLDTRNGTGVARGKVGPGGTVALQVAGRGAVPATGVSAVILNVTVTNPTAAGYVTVYPYGASRPLASNLNFTTRQTVPNQVTVPVVDGKIDLYNAFGTTDLVADVSGYYSGEGSVFVPTGPVRILDTRDGTGGLLGTIPGGHGIGVSYHLWEYGVPFYGARGAVLNVTATNPTAPSFLTVRGGYEGQPYTPITTSNLNFGAGETVANAVTTGDNYGGFSIDNHTGRVDAVADLAGYFLNG